MNNITIDGKLYRSPSSKDVGDTKVTNFAILHQSGKRSDMIGCEAWGALGKEILTKFVEGDEICVAGKLVQFSWDDKDTGKKQSKIRVRVSAYSGNAMVGYDPGCNGCDSSTKATSASAGPTVQPEAQKAAVEADDSGDIPF